MPPEPWPQTLAHAALQLGTLAAVVLFARWRVADTAAWGALGGIVAAVFATSVARASVAAADYRAALRSKGP